MVQHHRRIVIDVMAAMQSERFWPSSHKASRRATFSKLLKVALLTAVLAMACTTHPIPSTPPESERDWIREGSGAYLDNHERVFYGVGRVSGIRNPTLLRSSADNQAQKEVAKVVDTFVRSLAQGAANHIEDPGWMHRVVHNSMADAIIIDHHQDRETGIFYALCRLPLASVKSHLEVESALPQEIRRAMLDHADERHARMVQY